MKGIMLNRLLVLVALTTMVTTVASAAPPIVTRTISPASVNASDVVDVTISFTATEALAGFPALYDVVPAGWGVTDIKSSPDFYGHSFNHSGDNTVAVMWNNNIISAGTQVTVNYKLHVPADASNSIYPLTGSLTNNGATYADVTGDSNVYVGVPPVIRGDLNDNGQSADAGDLVLMKRASVGEITPDSKYDLNGNGIPADAGDLVLMKRASVGEIEL